ncbi:MAG: tRNA threonylcarbamoyladenosine dehydratase [Muribaculaceae bacterium]|nr:tRNA threonylcarbamoyladenosine dehydratase [Muribaculaceae bacterium]
MYSEIFDRTRLLLGDEAMERLGRARVIVFGIGGVGSWAVEALARTGIGHLTIVDSDTVAVSNINRQLVALNSTVGRTKVEVMAERIADINPDCDVTAIADVYTPENGDRWDLESYDIVIDAIDSLASKADLILRTTAARRPRLVSSMGAALKGDPLKIDVAEFGKVKGCPLARALRDRFKRQGVWPRRRFQAVYSPELLKNTATTEAEQTVNGMKVP